MGNIVKINYDIESVFDEFGRFPLECTIMLFDILEWKSNILIKNQYVAKDKRSVKKIIENEKNIYYEYPSFPEGNYCIWIKDNIQNDELIEVLSLQGIYMCCIQPTKLFDWNSFQSKNKKDESCLFLDNQASFICEIIDQDRVISLYFNNDYYPIQFIKDILCQWENRMKSALPLSNMNKIATKDFKSKDGRIEKNIELYFDRLDEGRSSLLKNLIKIFI